MIVNTTNKNVCTVKPTQQQQSSTSNLSPNSLKTPSNNTSIAATTSVSVPVVVSNPPNNNNNNNNSAPQPIVANPTNIKTFYDKVNLNSPNNNITSVPISTQQQSNTNTTTPNTISPSSQQQHQPIVVVSLKTEELNETLDIKSIESSIKEQPPTIVNEVVTAVTQQQHNVAVPTPIVEIIHNKVIKEQDLTAKKAIINAPIQQLIPNPSITTHLIEHQQLQQHHIPLQSIQPQLMLQQQQQQQQGFHQSNTNTYYPLSSSVNNTIGGISSPSSSSSSLCTIQQSQPQQTNNVFGYGQQQTATTTKQSLIHQLIPNPSITY